MSETGVKTLSARYVLYTVTVTVGQMVCPYVGNYREIKEIASRAENLGFEVSKITESK